MIRYLLGRVLQLAAVVFVALIVVFIVLHLIADPVKTMLPIGSTDEVVAEFRERHGFNDPFLVQFGSYILDIFQLDFGESLWLGGDALDAVLARLPATMMIAVPATVVGAFFGISLGVLASHRPSEPLSQTLNVVSLGSLSLAEFWVGIMAILLVSVQLGWLPTGGYTPKPHVMVLPILVLALRPFAQTLQLTRATMIAEGSLPYVMTAHAKGLGTRQVARRHVLRNAAIPVTTLGLYQLSRVLVGSAVVVEVVFSWPGIGRTAVEALSRGDVFLVQAVVAVAAVATVVINFVADLMAFALDPRSRSLVKGET